MATFYLDNTSAQDNSGTSDVADGSVLSGSAATSSSTVVTLDGSPDLSGLVTSGASQSAIYIASATATNRKIFFITAFDNTAKTVTVDVAPAIAATSAWVIGGRLRPSMMGTAGPNFRAGDVVRLKTDMDLGSGGFQLRFPSGGPGGFLQFVSHDGTRYLMTTALNAAKMIESQINGNVAFRTLQLQNTGTNGVIDSGGTLFVCVLDDCVVPDSGAASRLSSGGEGAYLFRTAWANAPVHSGTTDCSVTAVECYFHDITGSAFACSFFNFTGCIFDRMSTSAIRNTGNHLRPFLYHNTFYRGDDSAYEETSSTQFAFLAFIGNIFKDNGNAGTEYNIELASGAAPRFTISYDNCISIAGGRGGGNVSGYTLGATDITSDPLFVDPDASAGSRNFGLQSGSPGKGIAYTYQASLSISYMDMGAVQRQEAASGGGVTPLGNGLHPIGQGINA